MTTLREVGVDIPVADEAAALAAIYALGVQGVEVRDADTGALGGRVQVVAWLPPTDAIEACVATLGRRLGPAARVWWRDVPVEWDPGAAVGALGARFTVVAPGAAARSGRDEIVLDASLAFGDGQHPTTALCVEVLERRLPPGASVLDVGTGSGILAIVAARLGAGRVVAQDVDPLAVYAARRHVAANGVAVTVVDVLPDERFEVVMCNLYLAPLLTLLPTLATRVAPGGAAYVSGFTREAVPAVEAAAIGAGLAPVGRRFSGGWALVELSRS